jgi:hypothetical protein
MNRPADQPVAASTEAPAPGDRSGGGVVGWMSRHPLLLACAGLLLTAGLGVFAFDRNAENRFQRKIREIRARGEPTTVEELIAATPGLPDDENQFLRVMEAAREITTVPMGRERSDLIPWAGLARLGPSGTRLSAEQLAAVRSYLAEIEQPLARVGRSLNAGRGVYRPMLANPMINTLMPELSIGRSIQKVLAISALDAAERGDSASAVDHLADMYRFAGMWDGRRSMQIGAFVNLALVAQAMDPTERAINVSEVGDVALLRIVKHVEAIDLCNPLRHAWLAERVMFIDLLKWMRTNPGGMSGIAANPGPLIRVPGVVALNGFEMLDHYESLIAASQELNGESIAQAQAIVSSSTDQPWYRFMASLVGPGNLRILQLSVRAEAQRLAMLAAIAAERYRLKHGDWPVSLDVLVPEFLDAVPLDPFDQQPIRYARIAEGIKVWSIGEDFVDNGGDVRRIDPEPKMAATDAGWVILDPPLRGRPAE